MIGRCLILSLLALPACHTTSGKNERFFSSRKKSDDGVVGVAGQPSQPQPPGVPLPLPGSKPNLPLQEGPFFRLCAAKDQLDSQEALTLKAFIAATHQNSCLDAERWLRDPRNKAIMIESESIVALRPLIVLQHYAQIRDVYIKIAKGTEALCPLSAPQSCHFSKDDH